MKSIVAAIAALAVASVSAQNSTNILSVTAPLTGTVYTAGQDAIITWINPTVQTISQIVLAQGSATALQPVSVIATNVDASKGSYTWKIPADTAPGSDYALEFGTSPNLAYTGQFTIKAGSGSSNSSSSASASSSGAAASGSSASSSGSSSAKSPSSASGSSASAEESNTSAGFKNSPAALGALVLAGAAAAGLM
ncbi:hypothetical protein VTP01DRAFT_2995 [Rhizomucor pusillus]|uniref:uncharacterized protein n=1 Tax=Rhizomucor pusillus TaxID=4840 RepID=UPI0037447055